MALLRHLPALAESGVRRYMLGQVASVLGFWTQAVTLNLLLWELTHSASLLGLLNFLLYGPNLVVAPLFGSRLAPGSARRATLGVLAGSFAVSALLLARLAWHGIAPQDILVAALALGTLGAMETPARQLLLTSALRDRRLLPNAVAMNTMVFNIGRMVGPAIAAFAFSAAGAGAGFALNLAGLAVMLACVRGLHAEPVLAAASRAGGVRGALAFARSDALARRLLPVLACMGLFVGTYQTLIPVLAARQYGAVAGYTGLFFSCAGAGSFGAALLLASRFAPGLRALAWAPWLSAAALAGVAASTWPALAAPCFTVIGLTLTFTSTSINATLQQRAPDALRGGVVGLYSMAFMGSMPIGHLLIGALSSAIGPRWAFASLAGALSLALAALRALLGPLPFSTPRRPS